MHPLEALVPDLVLICHPAFGRGERFWRKLKTTNTSFLVRLHQAAFFEHRKMLREGRQGHVEGSGQFGCGCGPPRQPLDHGAPRRVGQRLEDATDRLSRAASPRLTSARARVSVLMQVRFELVERLVAELDGSEADTTRALCFARVQLPEREHGLAVALRVEGERHSETTRIVIDILPVVEHQALARRHRFRGPTLRWRRRRWQPCSNLLVDGQA